jgi:hypothetical protein
MTLYDHLNLFIASTLILEFIYIFSILFIGGFIIILMSNHPPRSISRKKSKYGNNNGGARKQMDDIKL